MSLEFGYANDPLRLAIISYITSNPNSTLEQIFRGIPASHTKVRHWLQELTRSATITPSAPIGTIPLQSVLWSIAGGGSGAILQEDGVSFVLNEDGTSKILQE